MIEQQGRVIRVEDGRAHVRLGGTTGCANCDAGKGCGAGVFGRLLKRKPVTLELDNTLNAAPGQPVMVGLPESLFLRLVARFYLAPLLAGVAGAVFGHYLSLQSPLGLAGSDMATLVFGLASGLSAMAWINRGTGEFPESTIVHLLRLIEIEKSGN